MKTSLTEPHPPKMEYNDYYWVRKFRLVGNAELAKEYPAVKKIIRRKSKMAIAFLLMCLLVVVWSKAVSAQHRPATAQGQVKNGFQTPSMEQKSGS